MNAGPRALTVLLVVLVLWPRPGASQTARAGVVTTLEGTATVTRTGVAEPVALRFKDDVFLRDRIATGERSLVRVLLGGKAVVTVRERSQLTITEAPGRAAIEVHRGKLALAVARERLVTGETIEIRTPNALAAVRGTVVIADVEDAAGTAAAATVSTLYVVRGAVEASGIDAARRPTGPTALIPAGEFFQIGPAGTRRGPNPALEIITAGLRPDRYVHTRPANQEQLRAQAMETAVALASTLTGPAPESSFGPLEKPGAPGPVTLDALISRQLTDLEPVVEVRGREIVLPPGEPFLLLEGALIHANPSEPFIAIVDSIVRQDAGDLFAVSFLGATLNSPLLRVTGVSQLLASQDFLRVDGGFTATTSLPLVSLDPTLVDVGGSLLHLLGQGVQTSLGGPFLHDAFGTLRAGAHLLHLEGSKLTSAAAGAFIALAGTTVTTQGHLVRLDGDAGLDLAGPLLQVAGASLTTKSAFTTVGIPFVAGSPAGVPLPDTPTGAEITGQEWRHLGVVLSSPDPAGQLNVSCGGTCLRADAVLKGDLTGAIAGEFFVPGTAIKTTTSTLRLDLCCAEAVTTLLGPAGEVLRIVAGASVDITPADGLAIAGFVTQLGAAGLIPGGAVGGLDQLAFGAVLPGSVLKLDGARISSPSAQPLIQLLALAVDSTVIGSRLTSAGHLVHLGLGAQVVLAGPLLVAAQSALDVAGSLVRIAEGSTLTSTTVEPLVTLAGGAHAIASTPGEALFHLVGSSTTTIQVLPGIFVALASDQPLHTDGALLALDGAQVAAAAGLRLDIALLTASAPLLDLRRGASLTTAGPAFDLVRLARLETSAPLAVLDAARLVVRAGAAVAVGGGSLLRVQGDLFQVLRGSLLAVENGPLLAVSGGSVVEITGALLAFLGATPGQVTIANALCPCTLLGDVPVAFANGATEENTRILIGTAFAGGAPGLGGDAAVILVDGPGATITIGKVRLLPERQPLVRLEGSVDGVETVVDFTIRQEVGDLLQVSFLGATLTSQLLAVSGTSQLFASQDFLRVDGAFTATTTLPLVTLDTALVDVGGSLLHVLGQGTRVDLAGPFLQDSGGTIAAGSHAFRLEGSTLASTTALPFVGLAGTTLTARGDLFRLDGDASLDLKGPLLKAVGTTLGIQRGPALVGIPFVAGSPNGVPLPDTPAGGEVTGQEWRPLGVVLSSPDLQLNVSCGGTCLRADAVLKGDLTGAIEGQFFIPGTSMPTTTSVLGIDLCCDQAVTTLFGPGDVELRVVVGNVDITEADGLAIAKFVTVLDAAGIGIGGLGQLGFVADVPGSFLRLVAGRLASATTEALVQLLAGSILTTTASGSSAGHFLQLGLGAQVTLAGPLLLADASTLGVAGSLVRIAEGAQLTSTTLEPLVTIAGGGPHTIASVPGEALFHLAGSRTTTVEPLPGVFVALASDEPLRTGGALLAVTGAQVTADAAVRLDVALLDASAPLLDLRPGAVVSTAAPAFDLVRQARLSTSAPLAVLDGARLVVRSGAAIQVAGGSVLSAGGDLFQLANGSLLAVKNGPLLAVTGGSIVNVTGALLAFLGAAAGQATIANALCPCTLFGGVPVAFKSGATPGNTQVEIGGVPFKGGAPTLKNDSILTGGTAVILVKGPGATIKVAKP